MNSDLQLNRPLMTLACLALALPVITWVCLMPRFGILELLADGVTAYDVPFLACLVIAAVFVVVWRFAGFKASVIWAGASLGAQTFSSEFGGIERLELSFFQSSPVPGITVYCNGVNLGESPFVIDDLDSRVSEWDAPPEQPRVDVRIYTPRPPELRHANWTWVPHDFTGWRNRGSTHSTQFQISSPHSLVREMEKTRQWWRFEKDGYLGLCSAYSFVHGETWHGGVRRYFVQPRVVFPSVEPHLEALLAVLNESDGKPDQAWLTHFLKYRDLLFTPLCLRTQEDDRLLPLIDQLVRAEFDLPEEPTRADCARVVASVVERVRQRGSFAVPSMESEAIGRVGLIHPEPIIEQMDRLLTDAVGSNFSSSGQTRSRSFLPERMPIEYAMVRLRLQPPELFDRLVYLNRREQFLELIAQYETKTAVAIVRSRLNSGQYGHACRNFHNPALEPVIREMFDRQTDGHDSHGVEAYILERIEYEELDEEFARWVASSPSLEADALGRLLAQIPTAVTPGLLTRLAKSDSAVRNAALRQLHATPHPVFDEYVIAACRDNMDRSAERNPYYNHAFLALGSLDTPAVRELVEEIVDAEGRPWQVLVNTVREPMWGWLVP